jgi:hypothetical protein
VLLETTSLIRTTDDLVTEQFEDALQDWLRRVDDEWGVYAVTELIARLAPEASQQWCEEIATAAANVAESGTPATVPSAAGTVTLSLGDTPVGIATFIGVPRERDLSYRLRKLVIDKAKQSAGPYPTWVRVDGLDGVFAFTAWAQGTPDDRIAAIADLLVEPLAEYAHIHGVIYSSGMMSGGYAAAPESLVATTQRSRGHFVRRSIARFLLREIVVLPVRAEGQELAAAWAAIYSSEPEWLDDDLAACGLPSLAQLRS